MHVPRTPSDEAMAVARQAMVAHIQRQGVRDERVLAAMLAVRRELFFPAGEVPAAVAYGDFPVSIGWGQTISQPFIVAYMTARLAVQPGERVLEIGSGSGYQAAVLAACGATVFSLERIPALARHAARVLAAQSGAVVQLRCADGYNGWTEEAPFDAIIGTCAPPAVPEALCTQLAPAGRMLLPVGVSHQRLVLVRRVADGWTVDDDLPVRFVPMVPDE